MCPKISSAAESTREGTDPVAALQERFLAAGSSVPCRHQTETLTLALKQLIPPVCSSSTQLHPCNKSGTGWLSRVELVKSVEQVLTSTSLPCPAWHHVPRQLWWHLPAPGHPQVEGDHHMPDWPMCHPAEFRSWSQPGYLLLLPGRIGS